MTDTVRPGYSRREWLPQLPSLVGVVLLFIVGLALTRRFEPQIVSALQDHGAIGAAIFFATTVLAVVFPLFTNLPLVPVAVLLWGPWWTALILTLGWIAGSAASFALAHLLARALIHSFPLVSRYTDIDRLIHRAHPIASLVVLRMTFPVDILSFALGLFSARTTASQNLISTALGVVPYALLFAFFPTLSLAAQLALIGAGAVAFLVYAMWLPKAD